MTAAATTAEASFQELKVVPRKISTYSIGTIACLLVFKRYPVLILVSMIAAIKSGK